MMRSVYSGLSRSWYHRAVCDQVIHVPGAHCAGIAQVIDLNRRGSQREDLAAAKLGDSVQIDRNIDPQIARQAGNLGIRTLAHVDEAVECLGHPSVHAWFECGPNAKAVTSNLDRSCPSNKPAVRYATGCMRKSAEKYPTRIFEDRAREGMSPSAGSGGDSSRIQLCAAARCSAGSSSIASSGKGKVIGSCARSPAAIRSRSEFIPSQSQICICTCRFRPSRYFCSGVSAASGPLSLARVTMGCNSRALS